MWQELMVKEEAEESEFSLLSTRSLVLFQALVTSGCFLVLGGLALWHAKLISRGETSIEAHINRCQAMSSVMSTLAVLARLFTTGFVPAIISISWKVPC